MIETTQSLREIPMRKFGLAILICASQLLCSTSWAKTFVVPHVLESQGSTDSIRYAFDTTIYMSYPILMAAGEAWESKSATVDVYLYDGEGSGVLHGRNGRDVCNPCSFLLDARTRKQTLRVEDRILAAGGFESDSNMYVGFGVLVVGGADPEGVNITSVVVNSHTSPYDLSIVEVPAREVFSHCQGNAPRTFVAPHVSDAYGSINSTPYSMDTTFVLVYSGGLPYVAGDGGGAMAAFYWYDQASGLPARSATGREICNPCSVSLSARTRKQTLNLEDLVLAAGGFPAESKFVAGFGEIVVSGADPDGINIQGFVVNSHSSANDLSISSLEMQDTSKTRRCRGVRR